MQTNLRFGCVILRHYLDRERGDLFMALGRYNGSRGQAEYPNVVFASRRQWLVSRAEPPSQRRPAQACGDAAIDAQQRPARARRCLVNQIVDRRRSMVEGRQRREDDRRPSR